jgi:hypothetical protein
MSETFETSSQASLPLTPNATSLPVLEDGPSLSGLQAGRIAAPCGPDPARANLSARQAAERGLLTSGTYGRPGSISSTSATLQRSLVNRLKQQLNTDGSTLFKMTWKESITPSLRWACLLRARARNTTGLDDGSLPTPSGTSNHGKNHVSWDTPGVGRIEQPVSWDRDWQSALREFRAVDDGLRYGVEATDAIRNAIVPQVAAKFIESYLDVSREA